MSKWIFAAVPRDNQGHPILGKLTVLESFEHKCEPHDRLKFWCATHPENLIYVLAPVLSGIGFNEFKVNITKHQP